MKGQFNWFFMVATLALITGCGTTGPEFAGAPVSAASEPPPVVIEPATKIPVPEPAVPAGEMERIKALVTQLGSDDPETRDKAQKSLEEWPADKIAELDPALKEAAQSKDPEVKMRAAAILKKIHPFTLIGANPQGFKEYRHEATGLVFVLVPGGAFRMGTGKDEHEVTVREFLIAKYEMTQGVYQKVMGNNPSYFLKGDNYPLENVPWENCQQFCQKTGLRLPTEAEWEYAARGGTKTKFYWGDDEKQASDYAWFAENFNGTTHPVGEKKPNGFGLYDMCGNVWEWCRDYWDPDYYKKSPKDNPTGPAGGDAHVTRGGGCYNSAAELAVTHRIGSVVGEHMMNTGNWVGFRPAADKPR